MTLSHDEFCNESVETLQVSNEGGTATSTSAYVTVEERGLPPTITQHARWMFSPFDVSIGN